MGTAPNLGPAIGPQDPANEPLPYKIYTTLDSIPLPREPLSTSVTALDALAMTGDLNVDEAIPDLDAVARLCLWSNGLLKRWSAPNGREIEFRSAGCTGARFHLELYLVCGDLPGLPAGVYHYAANTHTLDPLRAGDFRGVVVEATGHEPSVAQAPVIAVCTSTFWRNAWRYQDRAYRHVYWDVGTLFANVLTVAASEGLPAKVVLGYADQQINGLVDVDGEREATVALLTMGRSSAAISAAPEVTPLNFPTQPLSSSEIDFPLTREMHHASELASGEAAAQWRSQPLKLSHPSATGKATKLAPIADIPDESIVDVIHRRRSNRHYAAETPLPFDLFSTVIDRATRGTALDALDPNAPPLFEPYLIVNNVEGLTPGTYVVHAGEGTVELLDEGDKREGAAWIAVSQEYAADAHVNVYAMTELEPVLAHYGDRGYRLAQVEAALFAGRLQLAAHALHLGAVGSTSIDDEVSDFFAPRGAGSCFMFVAVFGIRRRASAKEQEASMAFYKQES
jgi:SagB-type dehydrogenase family enzyme